MTEIIYKEAREASGLNFVLSDETKDRMGDIIRADGWELANFKKNPIALFRHDSGFPIGNWKNVRVENKRLVGTLDLAPEGASPRVDEIIRLVRAGVLKAVSVGFRELESRPLGNDFRDGMEFIRQELLETSVVTVPANQNALQIAKSLGISADTHRMVFDNVIVQPVVGSKDFNVFRGKHRQMPSPHDGWDMQSYDLACRHLSAMAEANPYNEVWAMWRDEMRQRQMDFIRK